MIRVEQLTGGYGKKPIVQGIDLEIKKGEFFALLGPNGSGKTTLFKLITGQLPASSGDIFIAGKAMSKLTKLEKAKKVAVLSQEVQMTFDYTVEEIINLGRYPHQKGVLKMLSAYDRQVIDTVMEITKVERYRKTQFRLLSGGEKQRVLLAKALAQEPEILLLDEPTNHLDIKHTFQMLDLLKEWQQTKGLTVFAILHDLNIASLYADRVALLHEGSFLEVGDVNTLRKEQQLKKVYEVEVKTQAHPLVAKPQLHLTPAQSYVPDIMPLLESYQFERKERVAHLQFNQPLRALSNASVGAGMQWLQHFCFVADFSEGTETPLLARLENQGISPEQAAAVGFKGDVQDIVFSERRVAGVPVFIVAVIEVNDDTRKNVDAIHLMLVVDNHLQDKTLLDWYMVVTEAKVKACQRLKLQSVQSAKDVLLIASTQGASQPRHSEIGEAFRTGIEQAVFDVIEEGVLKVRYTIKTRMGDNYMSENKNSRRGLTLVYTGHGKGKTTAALGLALRSIGRGYQVKILQFIKSPQRSYGEQIALKKLGVGMEQLGIGFTWLKTPEEHREALKKAWPQARDAVMSGEYDVVILDELNNALAIDKFPIEDVLPLDEILETIKNRPSHVHLVITGRDALPEIKEIADLVSVIEPEKHYYDDGVEAVKGLEF